MFMLHVKSIDPNNLKLKSLNIQSDWSSKTDISDYNFQDKCDEYKNIKALNLQ